MARKLFGRYLVYKDALVQANKLKNLGYKARIIKTKHHLAPYSVLYSNYRKSFRVRK